MSIVTDKNNLIQEIQASFVQAGFGKDLRRQKVWDMFLTNGLPGPKTEEYKFLPVTRVLEKLILTGKDNTAGKISSDSSTGIIKNLNSNVVAFVNGKFSQERSIMLDTELKIQQGAVEETVTNTDPFALLNQAFAHEEVQITIGNTKTLQHPVAIVYYFDSSQFSFANPRWRCTIGAHSIVSLMECVVSEPDAIYFNNKQSVIEVGENAQLEYTMIQNGPMTDVQINNSLVHLSSSARASCFTFTFDGQLVRNNLTLTVDGEGVDAHLYGLYLLSKNTIADNHTVVDHKKPNSCSNELYKGVMSENSRGVFNGKIYVRPHAQKTNAFQSNRNIILSDTATVNTKPQLEIWADDVKCSHGCTTGQLDEEALFYLRSRGLSKDIAKGMLLYAFAAETFATMKNETIRTFIDGLVSEKLQNNF